jgi:hypothetical protein
MQAFDEFRVVVQPELPPTGKWEIRIQKSPRPLFVGRKGLISPVVKEADLARLRNATATPDVQALRQLGLAVVESIMTDQVRDALEVSIDDANRAGRGLRIVVSIVGNAKPPNGVGCHEIPVEAAFTPNFDFIATNRNTPVSRGVSVEADRPAVKIAPPLRILVVASEPGNMPPVQADVEVKGLARALQRLTAIGAVKLDFCHPATPERLDTMLQLERYHIVHFIGHGDFDLDGIELAPQAYLYFEDGTPARKRRPVDAAQLFNILQNGNVPLIVMTACASAESQPNGTDYPALAFEGLAQNLVARQGGPLAAVAMQFDLESAAAEVFSGALYEQLLNRHAKLDSAVAAARAALIGRFGSGHRSWINPTVYWRCQDGALFDFFETGTTLTSEQRVLLDKLNERISLIEEHLTDLSKQPPEIVAATAPLRAQWQAQIEALQLSRGAELGDSVRLRGGTLDANGLVTCELSVRLRLAAKVGDVAVTLAPDAAEFAFVRIDDAPGVRQNSIFSRMNANQQLTISAQNPLGTDELVAGEYVLATVTFRLQNGAAKALYRVPIATAAITRNAAREENFAHLDAYVFNA